MISKILVGPAVLLAYATVPVAAFVLIQRSATSLDTLLFDVMLSAIPMVVLAAFTWRLVWPKWKLAVKLLLHPCIYAILSVWIGHWSITVAWVHQGVLGLGGHIWFSKAHGFKWYAVEDAERYVALSKQATERLSAGRSSSS